MIRDKQQAMQKVQLALQHVNMLLRRAAHCTQGQQLRLQVHRRHLHS